MFQEMLDDIIECAEEKVKLSKGALVLLTVCSFLVGAIVGVCAAGIACHKKISGCDCCDDFDADDYVNNLDFDDE
ncbi:MAG: hypothetical protein LIO69_07145 [Oscillospiraceae bacterium]|nr:hypothetical protein [Oscillospiraceae bacterium]